MDIRKIVGRNLRQLRKDKTLTQEELAFMVKLDTSYISGIETGKRNPTVLVLWRLARKLGVQPAVFLMEELPKSDDKEKK